MPSFALKYINQTAVFPLEGEGLLSDGGIIKREKNPTD